jgi:hypothetical protein
MTGKNMREDALFMRNSYQGQGRWGIPIVRKQSVDIRNVSLIACSDTRRNDTTDNTDRGVHFFVDDYRFSDVYRHPQRTLEKFSQYRFMLTPDFSTYADMDMWRQIESVAQNRWVGAYWQEHGLTVVPTVSWSTPSSYEFCFDGIEKHSTVAVGMIGCKGNKTGFMRGYNAMLDKIEPVAIICFGTPFEEMSGNIIPVDYRSSRKAVR